MLHLADLIEALTQTRPVAPTAAIRGAVVDSRQAVADSLFVAVPGEHLDGHDFVADAFARGATFALVQHDMPKTFRLLDLRPAAAPPTLTGGDTQLCLRVENTVSALQQIARFWRSRLNVRVIGITGSVGKSTTKEVAAAVLRQRYPVLKNPGNLNNEIGLPLTLLSLTSREAYAVLEMGFYVPGEIELLCNIARPQVGMITNVGTVHAERAGSKEEIARGKAELVQALPPAPQGVAILNFDDPLVRKMAEKTKARVFFYGLNAEADLWADKVEGMGLEGIRFRLHYGTETIHLRVPLIGRHSVHTALRAAAVGLVEGLTWQEIVTGLQQGRAQLRLVTARSKCGALLIDDTYNASPESTLAALNLLEELSGRKIAVLGDMLELGQYETQGHEIVGVRAAQVADHLVTFGRRAHIIARSARQAGMPDDRIVEFEETDEIIAWLQNELKSSDSALIKGSRGLRMDRIVAALEAEK